MTWKKISVILSVLAILLPSTWVVVTKANALFEFQQNTERRHMDEDLTNLERRYWHLKLDYPPDTPVTPEVRDEIIQLEHKIQELKRQLGYQ